MKIGKIFGKNFGKVTEVSVNVNPELTIFIGTNKSGKTTIGLELVWFVMEGLAQRGDGLIAERYRFIGPAGPSAKGEIEIIDETEGVTHLATRKLLKDKTQLKIVSSDGIVRGQEFLSSIFSSIFFDLRKFSRISSKEQAVALGIDTSVFEQERKELMQIRHDIGVKVKSLKGVAESSMGTEQVEEISVADLLQERKQIEKYNIEVNTIRVEYQDMVEEKQKAEEIIQTLKKEIENARIALNQINNDIDNTQIPPLSQDTTIIDEKIQGAEEINTKARAYKQSLIDQQAYESGQASYDAETSKIQDLDARLAQYLHDQKLPFSNITIEAGEFRLNGKPFCDPYFSTGELLKYTAKLAAKIMEKKDQKLDYVWIPGSQDLDEKNRNELFQDLVKQGYQVAAEYVDTKKIKGKNCILLKECRIIDSYEKKQNGEELE